MPEQFVPPALDDAEIERVLIVSAHPDDHDFGSSGSIAGWTDRGIVVTYLICTDGQEGGFDAAVDRSAIPTIRRAEQRAAGELVGVHDVRFLGRHDGRLASDHDLVRDIVRAIRQVRPQRVVLQSPERRFDRIGASHPDHLAAGEATLRALYPAAGNPYAFPELLVEEHLAPWKVREMWIAAHPTDNHVVDVTDQVERKLAAILAHTSQHSDGDNVRQFVTEWMRRSAASYGLAADRCAELFAVYPVER